MRKLLCLAAFAAVLAVEASATQAGFVPNIRYTNK